jgi:hypothetical protein
VKSLYYSLSLTKQNAVLPHNMKMLGVVKDTINKENVHFCWQPIRKKDRLQLETGNDDNNNNKNNSFLDNLFEYVEELNELEFPKQLVSTSTDAYLESLYELSLLTLGTESMSNKCCTSLSSSDDEFESFTLDDVFDNS